MKIFVTGATGYIGAAVAGALAREGHDVHGLARSDEAARRLTEAGHRVVEGGLRDPDVLRRGAEEADAVVHAGAVTGSDTGEVDAAAVDALLGGATAGMPVLYTSGIWVLGDTGAEPADEKAPTHEISPVAWRPRVERRVLEAAEEGIRGTVIRPGIVHGRGGGIPAMLVAEARESGRVRVVGEGRQRWPAVHLDDLAELYVRALDGDGGRILHGTDGPSVRARDVALAACVAAGRTPAVEAWPLEEAREALGGFAEGLARDQEVTSVETRKATGWAPEGPSMVEELLTGSYA